jgi:hypothetical protein
MKKIKLKIEVKKGMTSTPIKECEIDDMYEVELFQLSTLDTFKSDAYFVVSLEELKKEAS